MKGLEGSPIMPSTVQAIMDGPASGSAGTKPGSDDGDKANKKKKGGKDLLINSNHILLLLIWITLRSQRTDEALVCKGDVELIIGATSISAARLRATDRTWFGFQGRPSWRS